MFRLIAQEDDDQRRLDRILRKHLPALHLSSLHRLIRKGKITVNGKIVPPGIRVSRGQIIEIPNSAMEEQLLYREKFEAPAAAALQKKEDFSVKNPEENHFSSLRILFEGSGLLILNKPQGIAVHGPQSLDDQVLEYLKPGLAHSLSFRPGPMHRLDKPSSGILVFSTNLNGARYFSALLRERKIRKQYLAIVDGIIEGEQTWNDLLVRDEDRQKTFASEDNENPNGKSKNARTRIITLANNPGHTLILADIETGRTHQIRSQCGLHGHPLSGDGKYGGKFQARGFLLHALRFRLVDPSSPPPFLPEHPQCLVDGITAPLPPHFLCRIADLFGENTLRGLDLLGQTQK
jgi:23S rRNA pseudouridine955/2504/2580 synthase